MFVRAVVLIVCCVCFFGCAAPNGGYPSAAVTKAAHPPSDYVLIGSAEGTDSKTIHLGINDKLLGDKDFRLSVMFGVEFLAALGDAKPARIAAGGSGDAVTDPIPVDSQAGRDALKVAASDLAARYPDRSDVKGYLVRSPSDAYLLYTVFNTGGGSGALYYDVSPWPEAVKKEF